MGMRGGFASRFAQKNDPECLGKAGGGKSAYKSQADYQRHAARPLAGTSNALKPPI